MLRFAEHAQAVANAQAWIAAWLRRESGPQYRDAQRLIRHGVTPRRILEELGALWLYASRNPRRLPDDIRLNSAMARCVMHLAPREVKRDYGGGVRSYRTTGRKEREAIGLELREALCMLLETITNPERIALARKADAAYRLAAFSYPLNLVIPNGPH